MIKQHFFRLFRYVKKQLWTMIVIYMVGIHNFYRQDDKTPEDIQIEITIEEEQKDSALKD